MDPIWTTQQSISGRVINEYISQTVTNQKNAARALMSGRAFFTRHWTLNAKHLPIGWLPAIGGRLLTLMVQFFLVRLLVIRHAKSRYNRSGVAMATSALSLSLFFHPLVSCNDIRCRRLSLSFFFLFIFLLFLKKGMNK